MSAVSAYLAPIVRELGRVPYRPTLEAMQRFTATRAADTPDELWLLEHPPVYTVGQAGRPEHLPRSDDIAVEHVDRGGQITFHGPGQIVLYALVDLARREMKVRALVDALEQATIDLLAAHALAATRRAGAPGVYVGDAKIAALGLRVKHGKSYHGLALNVDLDLAPFARIDPCGYPGLKVTSTAALGIAEGANILGPALARALIDRLPP